MIEELVRLGSVTSRGRVDVIKAPNDVPGLHAGDRGACRGGPVGFTIGSSLLTRLVLGVGAPAVLIAVWAYGWPQHRIETTSSDALAARNWSGPVKV